jgi:hypothetical protein
MEFNGVVLGQYLMTSFFLVLQSSPVNPGLVSIQYENITTDVFGLTNIGVGAFGMLKGRGSYIQTTFFDGRIWIEKGSDLNGIEYYNVYARDDGTNI